MYYAKEVRSWLVVLYYFSSSSSSAPQLLYSIWLRALSASSSLTNIVSVVRGFIVFREWMTRRTTLKIERGGGGGGSGTRKAEIASLNGALWNEVNLGRSNASQRLLLLHLLSNADTLVAQEWMLPFYMLAPFHSQSLSIGSSICDVTAAFKKCEEKHSFPTRCFSYEL